MKGVVMVLCGLVGGIAGGLLVPLFQGESKPASQRHARSTAGEVAALTEAIEDLKLRIRALETTDRSVPGEETTKSVRPDVESRTGRPAMKEGGGDKQGKPPIKIPKEVQDLVRKLVGTEMTASAADRLFGWLTLNKEKILATVAALEKKVKENPNDAELQVAYATALVAQLANLTQQGPQRGLVWMKASKAYDTAIKVNPEHWQARFGKAFGTSMAPEFYGLKPVAIKQFEKLREIQERQAPAPHHVQTYFRLGTLYKDMGNADKARAVWDSGLKLFPDNAVLKAALEASTKK